MPRIGDRDLHVERRGDGPPLLLIQGMSAHSGHWGEPLLDALAEDFTVVTYDHRGTGRSGPAEEDFTMADLAADAAGVLDALELASAHVLGVSMGGMVAQELALARPERVRSLTLGCTMVGGADTVRPSPEVLQQLAEALLGNDPELTLRTGYEVNLSVGHRADPAAWERFRESAVRLPVPPQARIRFMQAIAGFDTTARAGAIAAPALVIHGTADQTVPIGNGEQVARAIPGARLEPIEGAAHFFFWEAPERTAELVRAHALAVESVPG